jgi:hypothetical protein
MVELENADELNPEVRVTCTTPYTVTAWPRGISQRRYLAKGFTMGISQGRYLQGTTCCIHEDTKLRRKGKRRGERELRSLLTITTYALCHSYALCHMISGVTPGPSHTQPMALVTLFLSIAMIPAYMCSIYIVNNRAINSIMCGFMLYKKPSLFAIV